MYRALALQTVPLISTREKIPTKKMLKKITKKLMRNANKKLNRNQERV